jgi:hypothetical protein
MATAPPARAASPPSEASAAAALLCCCCGGRKLVRAVKTGVIAKPMPSAISPTASDPSSHSYQLSTSGSARSSRLSPR